jgi:amino acid adenylation domain-containing protein
MTYSNIQKNIFVAKSKDTIAQQFENVVHQYPDNIAAKSIYKHITYAGLNVAANRLAHAIIEHLGLKSEPVAILCGHDVEQFIAIIGVLKAGKFYVPLDPSAPLLRNTTICADAGIRLIVSDDLNFDKARALTQHFPVLHVYCDGMPGENLDIPVSPVENAFIIYTSGSTGKPKGVVWQHRDMLYFATNSSVIDRSEKDRVLMVSKYYFSGSLGITYGTLLSGGALYLFDVQTQGIKSLPQWIDGNHITIYQSVPTLFRQLMAILTTDRIFPSVRIVSVGGEPSFSGDFNQFKAHFLPGTKFRNGYGLTEVKFVSSLYMDHSSETHSGVLPVGYPVEGVQVVILNDKLEEMRHDEEGEIAVISQYMAAGYWHRPELTAKNFLKLPGEPECRMYLTGDMGKLTPDGCLIHLGRKDFQVKIHGNRIELGEIEAALLKNKHIFDAVVSARMDREDKLRLVAYIVPRHISELSISVIRSEIAQELPSYMLPTAYVVLDALPKTVTGKIDRQSLPEPGWSRPDLDIHYVPPRTPLEQLLVDIWKDVLGIDCVGIHDDFFELGGDSIMLMKFMNRLQMDVNQAEVVQSVFDHGTIAGIISSISVPGVDPE